MRKLLCLLLILLLLPLSIQAEGRVVNLIDHPDAEWSLDEEKPLLEIFFPAIHGSDCCILRMQDQIMMIDCSTDDQSRTIVADTLRSLGITHIDLAVNSHPHDDHLTGFAFLPQEIRIGSMYLGLPQNYNQTMRSTLAMFRKQERVAELLKLSNGDTLSFADSVIFDVMQHTGPEYTTNDKSLVLNMHYGNVSMIFLGDVESRGQHALVQRHDASQLKADIMKYPHHGHSTLYDPLLKAISPELAIVTAHEKPAKHAFDYLKEKELPGLSTWYGMIRIRTDGEILVIDRPETEAPITV